MSKLRCKYIYKTELTGDYVKTELFGYIAVLCKVMFTKFMNVQYICFKPDATGLVKRKRDILEREHSNLNVIFIARKGKRIKMIDFTTAIIVSFFIPVIFFSFSL